MASTYSTNLKIELQATGENSGTWGTITNTNLGTALEQAIVGYGNPNYTSDANLTLTYTDTNAAQAARALVLNVTSTGSLSATRELVVPTIQKQYIVQNNTSGSQSITVKTSGGTGITVPNGRKAHLYVDGTNVIQMFDFVDINGGAIDGTAIGASSASTGAFTSLTATSAAVTGASGILTSVAATQDAVELVGRAGGTASYKVTLTPTTLSASRTLTLPDVSGTVLTTGAAVTVAQGGTGATTLTGVLKGNGTSAFTAATAGTDYVAPGTATTFTATQTFNGSSSALAMVVADTAETTTISATAATGTINYDVTTQSVLYYTTNASANWTVNFRASSGTSLNTLLSTGQAITVAFLVTQGSTAYYNSAVQVDGASVTPKYQGGTAWTAGNASGIDAYTYTIIKTGSAAFTVFAAQTRFA